MAPQLGIRTLTDKLVSHALALGHFASVSAHEPKNAPPEGIHAAVWVQEFGPCHYSGLNATAVRIMFTLRGYSNMLAQPQDEIDPQLVDAIDALMAAFTADFRLGDTIVAVDLLGETGTPLSAKAGYVTLGGQAMYRIIDLTIPLVVDEVYDQAP